MMKKFLAAFIATVLLITMVACSGGAAPTTGTKPSAKVPTIDDLTNAFLDKGYTRDRNNEESITQDALEELNIVDCRMTAMRIFGKVRSDDSGTGVSLFYLQFDSEVEAKNAFYAMFNGLNSEAPSDEQLATVSGKNGLKAKGNFSDSDDGLIVMLSQMGNTLVYAVEGFDRYGDSGAIYNGEMVAIMENLGY